MEIAVFMAFDTAYCSGFRAAVTSVLQNLEKNRTLHLFVAVSDPTDLRSSLRDLQDMFPDKLTTSVVQNAAFATIGQWVEREHLKRYASWRCAIDLVIPPRFKRVIYLDCDLVVNCCLGDLYLLDLQGYPVGAALDFVHNRMGLEQRAEHYPLATSVDRTAKYFNSGVLLIDLLQWREGKVFQKCCEIHDKYRDILRYPDQDILNFNFANNWAALDPEWNFQNNFAFDRRFPHDRGGSSVLNPKIIHFTGYIKPWHSEFRDRNFRWIFALYNQETFTKVLLRLFGELSWNFFAAISAVFLRRSRKQFYASNNAFLAAATTFINCLGRRFFRQGAASRFVQVQDLA